MSDQKEVKLSNTKEKRFTKDQIIVSSKFTNMEKHILDAVLKNEKLYSLEETKKLLKNFNERKVI